MKKAPFFVLDGGEGAGKSTLLKRLKAHYGDRLVATREPGGCPRAEALRTEIFAHAEWSAQQQFDEFWRARAYHIEDTIRPALEAGKIVVCDRFDSSTFAYQIWEKKHPELIEDFWEKRRAIVGDNEPNLYIYMDVDVERGLARKKSTDGIEITHFDVVDIEDQKRRQDGFKKFFGYVPHVIVDANKSEDEVFAELVGILESRLK